MTKSQKRLWIGLIILAFFSPLGIILPDRFGAKGAWGEWSTETLQKVLGYVPEGLRKYSDVWKAPLADYSFGGQGATYAQQIIYYMLSGLLGILLVGLMIYAISKLLVKHEK
ncbi:MAG: cobalamin biosynthesis protein [Syntrophus sp. (in: bacteria)]|nr:cobalamin biosynthesis protein [Syntrophus sp. (in: bacteria)]